MALAAAVDGIDGASSGRRPLDPGTGGAHERAVPQTAQRTAEEQHARRVAELREQCQLEQQAKAHLEDALRTDLEERDETLKLLHMKVPPVLASGA